MTQLPRYIPQIDEPTPLTPEREAWERSVTHRNTLNREVKEFLRWLADQPTNAKRSPVRQLEKLEEVTGHTWDRPMLEEFWGAGAVIEYYTVARERGLRAAKMQMEDVLAYKAVKLHEKALDHAAKLVKDTLRVIPQLVRPTEERMRPRRDDFGGNQVVFQVVMTQKQLAARDDEPIDVSAERLS